MTDQYPRITVVTPSYNQAGFLEQTIISVLSQGYPNLEYIIIDGGSSDHSVEIIKKYEDRLFYWISEPDKGLYDGIQKGFAVSTGEIMCWINSDDLHHRKSLKAVADLFSQFSDIRWVMGCNTFYDEEGKSFVPDPDRFYQRWSKWRMYDLDGQFIQQESVFWRRTLWNEAGAYIDSSLHLAGDADLWLRFFRHEQLYTTTLILAGFRIRRGQKSSDQFDEYMTELRMLIKRELVLSKGRAYLRYVRFVKFLARFIPIMKYRHMLLYKTMKITPKVAYHPKNGYFLDKKYKL